MDNVFELAKALGRVSRQDEDVLRDLCALAEEELAGRLRPGVSADDCGGAFRAGCAWIALAGLCAGERLERVSAGGLTIAQGGKSPLERAAALRRQAEQVMAPYVVDEDFTFRAIRPKGGRG